MPSDQEMPSTSRKSIKRGADDMESRRARGEISCAECRRLKLKCDRKVPCSSCIRRGCPSICPNGSLSSGQGTRYVLADTPELHAKINEMGQRIRQLEDALAISHSSLTKEPHPLLRDELMPIKFGPERNVSVTAQRSHGPSPETLNATGTLTFGRPGEGKYFGRSAGTEAMIISAAPETENIPHPRPALNSPPVEILSLSSIFPIAHPDAADRALRVIYAHLPPRPRAWSLCETYMEHMAWQFSIIRRDELIEDIMNPIYRNWDQIQESNADDLYSTISSHKLSLLFGVYALGTLADLTIENYIEEAENYFQLARAAIGLSPIHDSQEVATVQAISMMGLYHNSAGQKYTADSSWVMLGLACKVAQAMGLHRDGSRWQLATKTVQRRRSLFYELTVMDTFLSLVLGRPPSFRMSYIDCELPTDEEVALDMDGNPLMGFYQWKYEFYRDIFSQLIELTLTAEPPDYQIILDLDRRVREKTLPPHLNMFLNPADEHCTPATYMRGCLLASYRSITLLYLHRSFFAQAMLDHPINPLRSPYAPSFLAAYRCASGVIKATLQHYERFPVLSTRWWGLWTHLFSAAIIVGTIVTHSPSSTMAANAFEELGIACALFEKVEHLHIRSKIALSILTNLRDKATQVYSHHRSGTATVGLDYGDDELALFGGQTKAVFSKLLASASRERLKTTKKSTGISRTNSPTTTISADSPDSLPEALKEVHPSLVEYISLLPASQQPAADMSYPNMNPMNYQHNFIPSPYPNMDVDRFNVDTSQSFQQLPQDNLMELGLMLAGNAGIDDQWKSFMREAGIMDGYSS